MQLSSEEMLTFAFHFTSEPDVVPCQLVSLGWQNPQNDYYRNAKNTSYKKQASYAFQYTLSGRGEIETNGHTYKLEQGQAFFVSKPGPSSYYLPEDSKHWEFLYVQLVGDEAERTCRMFVEKLGGYPFMPPDSEPILTLWSMWRKARDNEVYNGFIGAKLAYSFLMELQAYIQAPPDIQNLPLPIRVAVNYIGAHYAEPVSVEELAAVSRMSRSHFFLTFKRTVGMAPVEYLTTVRIKKAADLLLTTPLPIGEIGRMVGYENFNYFSRTFRAHIGCSPREFRSEPADRLILERNVGLV